MVRMDRLGRANLGDCEAIGNGIYELRVDQGPGYRIYFGFLNPHEVVILCGGDKATQRQDIEKAKQYFQLIKGQA